MQTDYDKFTAVIRELNIPAQRDAPLDEPKYVMISNDQQGTKAKFNFDKDGRYQSVTFV